MTPEGSQSSEEFLNSEENNSAAPSSSSQNVQLRVKNVSEINSNEAEADPSPSPPTKRKLPSWMLLSSQENGASNKKQKTVFKSIEHVSTSTINRADSGAPSTSSDHTGESTGNNALVSDGHAEADGNLEVSAHNGDVGCGQADTNEEPNNEAEPENNVRPSCSASIGSSTSSVSMIKAELEANDNVEISAQYGEEADTNDGEELSNEAEAEGNLRADVKSSGSSSTGASTSHGKSSGSSVSTVKNEPIDNEDNDTVGVITPTSARDIKPAVKVKKEEATSSTTRESCKFGIRCYRQNPIHRSEEAHPGDKDYKRPDFPAPPDGTPNCPYGDLCYRRNPVHFQQYSHPPSTDFNQNWKNHKMRLRQRQQPTTDPNSSYLDLGDDEEDDLEDPFINDDSDEEFIPNTADFEEDDEDDL